MSQFLREQSTSLLHPRSSSGSRPLPHSFQSGPCPPSSLSDRVPLPPASCPAGAARLDSPKSRCGPGGHPAAGRGSGWQTGAPHLCPARPPSGAAAGEGRPRSHRADRKGPGRGVRRVCCRCAQHFSLPGDAPGVQSEGLQISSRIGRPVGPRLPLLALPPGRRRVRGASERKVTK